MLISSGFGLLLLFPRNSSQLAYLSIKAISAIKNPFSIDQAIIFNNPISVLKVQVIGRQPPTVGLVLAPPGLLRPGTSKKTDN